MKVAIAGDHYTVELVQKVQADLVSRGIEVENLGTDDTNKAVTLQEIIPKVAKKIQANEVDCGILACGSGVGVEIGANRFKGVRGSLCRDASQAKNARVYDNANLLCLGSWYADDFEAILKAWLENEFDGDEHRAQMLQDFDNFAD